MLGLCNFGPGNVNEPLSNFFPSLSMAFMVNISSNTMFDVAVVMIVKLIANDCKACGAQNSKFVLS